LDLSPGVKSLIASPDAAGFRDPEVGDFCQPKMRVAQVNHDKTSTWNPWMIV
jgi:hypothetical protein